MPQELGWPLHEGSPAPLPEPEDANTENFFANLTEPQWGHSAPSQLLERTRISLSFSHFWQ
jgi:hypothetical protein